MLMSAVVLPEAFAKSHFEDPTYHLNTEILLRGIDANGLILVDAKGRLYNQLCDNVEQLAGTKKGKTTHALFEELLKKKREQKIVRFVSTQFIPHASSSESESCASLTLHCRPDAVIAQPDEAGRLAIRLGSSPPVISTPDYIGSRFEAQRRRFFESLPPLDHMASGEFDRLIVGATRYTKWLRFYDKQIGKGSGLPRFRRGIERILALWTANAYFPLDQLSAELFTAVDKSISPICDTQTAHNRVRIEIAESLSQQFDVPFQFYFKQDSGQKSISHPRHLQTQSIAIMFEKGFDFIENDGSFSRTTIKPDSCGMHLQEYRQLTNYTPPL